MGSPGLPGAAAKVDGSPGLDSSHFTGTVLPCSCAFTLTLTLSVLLSPLSPPDGPTSLRVLSLRAPGSCYPCLPSPDSRDHPHLPLLPPCLHRQLPSPVGLSCVGFWAQALAICPIRACTSHSFVPGPSLMGHNLRWRAVSGVAGCCAIRKHPGPLSHRMFPPPLPGASGCT